MKTLPLDPLHMENGYTVLSAELSKQLDRQERSISKGLPSCNLRTREEMLNESNNMLEAVQDMGNNPSRI